MNKLKDILLLLFWGLVGGAVFVGCILGFFFLWNSFLSKLPIGSLALPLLGIVIVGTTIAIAVFANRQLTRKNWTQAAQFFSPTLLQEMQESGLHRAVIEQREDIIDQLRFYPLNMRQTATNASISNGLTPLHLAAMMGRKKFCKRLLKFGADPTAKDSNGLTPLDYAKKFNETEVIKLLEN